MIEKSKDMEKRYEGGVDTWGNRERQLYQKIFKAAVDKVKAFLDDTPESTSNVYNWVDIGCGGANILDTIMENQDPTHNWDLYGCDMSSVALEDVRSRYPNGKFMPVDLEEYCKFGDACHYEFKMYLSGADVVSIVDVAYYFGEKRPWKETMKAIWDDIRPGAIVIVADSLIPYQRRSYFSTLKDCQVLDDYTDYTEQVSEEHRSNGGVWHRYFKVKIYKKVSVHE